MVQTKRQCYAYGLTRAMYPFHGDQLNKDNNASFPAGVNPASFSSIETGVVWTISHNNLQVWPCAFLACPMGQYSGFEHVTADRGTSEGETAVSQQWAGRNGKEIFCKGISLKMQVGLDKVVPYCNLKIMLVKSKKGDTPHGDTGSTYNNYTGRNSNFYMGYSQNKQLDMVDNARHHILKTWHRTFRQNGFTTIGSEATADGQAVDNANPEKMSSVMLLQGDNYLTPTEWEAKIAAEYPDYEMFGVDHFQNTTEFNIFAHNLGWNGSKPTMYCKYSMEELGDPSIQEYKVMDDGSDDRDAQLQLANAADQTVNWYSAATHPSSAPQCFIHRKLSAGAPSDDVVQYKHSALLDIWIPGRLIRKNRRFRYEDQQADKPGQIVRDTTELEGMYEYNLVFYTYGNFTTWTRAGVGSDTPNMLHVNDFQQIMYYRDP